MMKTYAEYGFGLVLCSPDEIKDLLERHDLEEVYDLTEQCCNVQFYGDDAEGLAFSLPDYSEIIYPDRMLVFMSEKCPNPFRAVYTGMEDLIREFSWLHMPEGFDWKAHIGWYQAVVSR